MKKGFVIGLLIFDIIGYVSGILMTALVGIFIWPVFRVVVSLIFELIIDIICLCKVCKSTIAKKLIVPAIVLLVLFPSIYSVVAGILMLTMKDKDLEF